MPTARIAKSALIITLACALVGSGAYLKDASTGYTFSTKGIDLKIDSVSYYNGQSVPSATWSAKDLNPTVDKFFNFPDVKPGDFGCTTISLHVKNQDAWMCLDFKNFESSENVQNEAEYDYDANGDNDGELAKQTHLFAWLDNGNGKYEPKSEKSLFGDGPKNSAVDLLDDKTYTIGDSGAGGSCKPNTTRYVGMCWCAGTISVDKKYGKITCDPSGMGNESQTDKFNVDMAIRALPVTDKPKYLCSEDKPHSPKKPKEKEKDDDKKKKDEDERKDWSGYQWPKPQPPTYKFFGSSVYTHK